MAIGLIWRDFTNKVKQNTGPSREAATTTNATTSSRNPNQNKTTTTTTTSSRNPNQNKNTVDLVASAQPATQKTSTTNKTTTTTNKSTGSSGSYSAPAVSAPASTQNDALAYMETMFNKLIEAQYNNPYAQYQQAALEKLLNRPAFSYNHLEDPAYQAYAKQYAFYGDQARQDTLGDVAGMTGGMPSSYAVSAAQQAQNQWNSRLTDIIPELQNAAYQRYQGDFENTLDVSNILNTLDSTAYSKFDNDRNFAWSGASTIGGMQYQVNRDKVLDSQWLAQFNADEAQRAVSNAISQKQISIQEGNLALAQAEALRNNNSHWTSALQEAMASGDPLAWLQANASAMTPEMYEWIKSQISGTSSSGI